MKQLRYEKGGSSCGMKGGINYEGPTHKDADGKLMTGATHTAESVYL